MVLNQVKVTDFFGNVQNIELTRQRYPLMEADQDEQEEVSNDWISSGCDDG